jgi:hypothetical protein
MIYACKRIAGRHPLLSLFLAGLGMLLSPLAFMAPLFLCQELYRRGFNLPPPLLWLINTHLAICKSAAFEFGEWTAIAVGTGIMFFAFWLGWKAAAPLRAERRASRRPG